MNYLIMPDVTNPGNPVNEASKKPINTRSTFDLSYSFFDTHRFGEYHPHFVFDGVPDDKNIQMNSAHDLRSYSLQAPLMQDISMKKDYFAVPLSAILPLNWEKWYKAPNIGDDVSDNVGPVVPDFWSYVSVTGRAFINRIASLYAAHQTDNTYVASDLTATFRCLIWLEYFYSNGCLLKSLGISGNHLFEAKLGTLTDALSYDFDSFFDQYIADLISDTHLGGFDLTVDGVTYPVCIQEAYFPNSNLYNAISFHAALSLMRDNLNFTIDDFYLDNDSTALAGLWQNLEDIWSRWTNFTLRSVQDCDVNLSRIFAYQIACAHFYSSDNIDYIYSADLYRQLIQFCSHPYNDNVLEQDARFSYNGVRCLYDSLSGYNFYAVLNLIIGTSVTGFVSISVSDFLTSGSSSAVEFNASCYRGYFSNILAFRRSLRYQDYFTGSRSTPLAVGDSNVSVSNSQVNVIDMASGIQKTRLWNAVSRAGSKIRKYMREIMGTEIPMDYHDPYFLAHTSDNVFGSEVENTGAAQQSQANSVTAVLRSNGARYAFNFDVDIPCVILGITYYDLPRVYTQATEKQNFAANRFDLFNPFLQFAGDQSVSRMEIGLSPDTGAFSYQLRDMQYKQRYNQAAGGFVDNLPGYMFIADDRRFRNFTTYAINDEFIRSLPSEIDDFYVSLTGYSLGSYFHFIVKNVNSCKASRPMAYAPSIL